MVRLRSNYLRAKNRMRNPQLNVTVTPEFKRMAKILGRFSGYLPGLFHHGLRSVLRRAKLARFPFDYARQLA